MMLRPKEVHYYLPLVDKVAKTFVAKVESSLDENLVAPDLRVLVAKWSLECEQWNTITYSLVEQLVD